MNRKKGKLFHTELTFSGALYMPLYCAPSLDNHSPLDHPSLIFIHTQIHSFTHSLSLTLSFSLSELACLRLSDTLGQRRTPRGDAIAGRRSGRSAQNYSASRPNPAPTACAPTTVAEVDKRAAKRQRGTVVI